MKPGGTEGGSWQFVVGSLLCVLAAWLFFDSVRVVSGGGLISGMMRGGRGGGGGGMGQTTSMGIIFVPFFIGLVGLFYNARLRWAWLLFWVGLAIIVIEMVSRIRFQYIIKSSHFIMMIVMFAAGAGFILRAVQMDRARKGVEDEDGWIDKIEEGDDSGEGGGQE